MSDTIEAVKTRKIKLVDKAKHGKELLENNIAVVSYQNKIWDVGDLLRHLAEKVIILKKKRLCVPKVTCLFKAQEHLDKKYIKKVLPNELY